MKRVLFAVATVGILAFGCGTASAQAPGYPTYPTPVPVAPVVGVSGTLVTPTVIVAAPAPTVVLPAAYPVIRVGYPWYYGRGYYYGGHYHRHW